MTIEQIEEFTITNAGKKAAGIGYNTKNSYEGFIIGYSKRRYGDFDILLRNHGAKYSFLDDVFKNTHNIWPYIIEFGGIVHFFVSCTFIIPAIHVRAESVVLK